VPVNERPELLHAIMKKLVSATHVIVLRTTLSVSCLLVCSVVWRCTSGPVSTTCSSGARSRHSSVWRWWRTRQRLVITTRVSRSTAWTLLTSGSPYSSVLSSCSCQFLLKNSTTSTPVRHSPIKWLLLHCDYSCNYRQEVLRSVVFVSWLVRSFVCLFVSSHPPTDYNGKRAAGRCGGGRRCGRVALCTPGGVGALRALFLVSFEIW